MKIKSTTRTGIAFVYLFVLVLTPLWAQKRILFLGWNVEAGESNPDWVETRLKEFEGYDILGLCEANPNHFEKFRKAAEFGEGSKNRDPSFRFVPGTTGGSNLHMMIIFDQRRFDQIGAAIELNNINDGNHRSPLAARFKLKGTSIEFLFMVNHLARGNTGLRREQAEGLREWAKDQSLPVIAVGDYNYDYDIDDGEGNQAFDIMLEEGVFTWVRPNELFQTQLSARFFSVLDFMFASHTPSNWEITSKILTDGFSFPDTNETADHRPVQGRILIR